MSQLPAGTVTFLAAVPDTDPSTTAATPSTVADFAPKVRAVIEGHQGHLLARDDASWGAFSSALAAVRAAADLRRLPDAAGLRIAVSTGPVNLRQGQYSGPVVERTRQILFAGHPGQTLVSAVTRELVRDYIDGELVLKDLGISQLRDLQRPLRLFQLDLPGKARDFPPVDRLDAYLHNLPVQATSFLGRQRELAAGQELLVRHRLVSVRGVEGTGKSRLALQLAAAVLHRYPDGAWRADLAGPARSRRVPEIVVAALGIREQAGRDPLATLQGWLADKQALLLLDNCERQHAETAALATALLEHCPKVSLLVTGEEPLGLPGEAVLDLPPLGIPLLPLDVGGPLPAALSQYEAVELFLDRAAVALAGFEVNNDNLPAIAEICHRVGGIPLGVELAAARLADIPVDDIAADLAGRFDDISGALRLPLPRQQILREVVAWSSERLPEAERRLLSRLSVFGGRFGLDGVAAVCALGDQEAADAPGLLWKLVGRALLKPRPEAGSAEFQLLPPIQAHALELLSLAGEEPAARDRHLRWVLQWARAAEEVLSGPEPGPTLSRMERQHDNFRAALEWGLSERRMTWEGVELAGHLGQFWQMRGHYREGRDWLERALARCEGTEPGGMRALVSHRLAWMLVPGSPGMERGSALLAEALAVYQERGDLRSQAWALNDIGWVALNRGDAAAAERHLEQSLALKQDLGNDLDIGMTLSNLGELARLRGDFARARVLYEDSLAHLRRVSREDRSLAVFFPLMNLGYLALHEGNPAAAAARFHSALQLEQGLGDPRNIAAVLAGLGGVAAQRGQADLAGRLFGAVEAVLARLELSLDRTDQQDLEANRQLASGQLAPAAWEEALGAGRRLSLGEAIALGMGEAIALGMGEGGDDGKA